MLIATSLHSSLGYHLLARQAQDAACGPLPHRCVSARNFWILLLTRGFCSSCAAVGLRDGLT